jgi:DNA-binding NtrC family response regulator
MMSTILIIDDDDQLRKSFHKLLTEEGYTAQGAASGEAGLEIIQGRLPDLVIVDIRLPGMDGLETFEAIHDLEPKLPVIIMTAYGTTETAIEATKMGAFDYILKPFEIPDMLAVIKQALEAGRFMRTPVQMDGLSNKVGHEAIVGRSKPMQDVYKAIGRVSTSDATVLIRGESGTGKELVARAIYQHSLRAQKPFLVINCVAIPENLLESELFGDEIGDMPSSIQSKILRLLQEKSIERLGGRQTIPVDVRILAATNRDLETALAQGRFREDLYYRLKVVTIELPPLRQRRDDIPLLTDFFLARYAAELGMDNPGITPDAIATLNRHPWPGNVRELANTLQKALIFSRGAPIRAEDVIQALSAEKIPGETDSPAAEDIIRRWMRVAMTSKAEPDTFEKIMDHLAGLLVGEALNLTDGNRSRAAKLLGLSRPTLHSKIEKYGLRLRTSVEEKNQD